MAAVRRIFTWAFIVFSAEVLRTQAPHYLPILALTFLTYGTWELLNLKPLRRRISRIYSVYGERNRLITYLIIFFIGGALLCLYWWGSNKVFSTTWFAKFYKQQGANPPNVLTTEQGTVITTEKGEVLKAESPGTLPPPAPTSRHINTSTVLEIHKELEQAGPLERDEVAEQFRHGIVDWTLIFHGDLIRPRGEDLMTVRFLPVNSPYPKIKCPGIKVEGNAYLGRIRSPTRFRVRGVIGDIDLNWFTLHEATFEQLADVTPTPVSGEQPTPAPSAPVDSDLSHRVVNLENEVKQLRKESPSVDYSARSAALQSEGDLISKKREELTKPEKETLDLTLQSLEEGRKRYLADKGLQDRQQEITSQREQIEREKAEKDAAKALELDESEFAKRYTPILDDAIATLHRMLRQYSEKSVEKISSDFPNGRPSINRSNMLKDGKIVEGQQVIRVGSSKDWEFRLLTAGRPYKRDLLSEFGRQFGFAIKAGTATASISSLAPLHEPPTKLRLTLSVEPAAGNKSIEPRKPSFQQDCSLTEYQKPMEELFNRLIQNRYNATPLTPKN